MIDDDSRQKVFVVPYFMDYRCITSALEQAGFLIRERKVWIAPL